MTKTKQKLRKCRRCENRKPASEFVDVSGEPNPRGGYCLPCHLERVKEWEIALKKEQETKLRKLKIIYGVWWRHYAWPQDFDVELYAERDECPYCARNLPPMYLGADPDLGTFRGRAHMDHMDPLALGGEDSIRNVVYVCDECNYEKRDMSFINWLTKLPFKQRELCRSIYSEKHGHPPEGFVKGPQTGRGEGSLAWLHLDEEDVLDMFPEPIVDGPPDASDGVFYISLEAE